MSLRNNSLAWIDLKKHISDNTEPDFTINLSFFVNENIPNYSTVSGEQGKKFTWATAWTKACRYRWTCPHSRRLIGCVGFNRGDLAILVTRRFTIQFVLLSIWIISPLVDFIVFFFEPAHGGRRPADGHRRRCASGRPRARRADPVSTGRVPWRRSPAPRSNNVPTVFQS